MKIAIVFLAIVAYAYAAEYPNKYDNIDVDSILRSDRLLQNYVKCLLETGNCTPDGKELKRLLPDALKTGCEKCSQKQREGSEKVIRFLVNERPHIWEQLSGKYDPNNEYKQKFQGEASRKGIRV